MDHIEDAVADAPPADVLPDVAVADDDVDGPARAQEPPPPVVASTQPQIDDLAAAVDRLAARVSGDQDIITRMQARIDALQADQVRALLGPAVTRLAGLHADFAETAERDFERLGFDRLRKELSILAEGIEDAIDAMGAESVEAEPGATFDSRLHTAVRQIPTADAALDKTIARVVRQGYTFDPQGRPALYARVIVHAYAPSAEDPPVTDTLPDVPALPDTP